MRDLPPHEREALIAELREIVRDAGNQTEAAMKLGISQQAVSAALGRGQLGHPVGVAIEALVKKTRVDLVAKHGTSPAKGSTPNLEIALSLIRASGQKVDRAEPIARQVAASIPKDFSVATWGAMLLDLEKA